MSGKYDDIIYEKRPPIGRHKPMSLSDRAAQFMPFKALVGFEDEIEDTRTSVEESVLNSERGEKFFEAP